MLDSSDVAPKKTATLDDILRSLSDLDAAPAVEFDPTEVVGDLKDKVDAIYKVMGRLKSEAARLDEIAEQFLMASKACEKNADRLKEYVIFTMRKHGFDKLPGKEFRVQMQKTTPSVEVEREAGPEDQLAFPHLVVRKTTYAWEKKKLREWIESGGSFEYGRVVQGNTVRFYINRGDAK